MIRMLKMSLEIDMTYAINSFIYVLRKLPIFKDLFTDDIYKSKILKRIVRIFGIVLSTGRMIVYRLLYFFIIYFISSKICSKNISLCFVHIYFIFTVIGMFINNKLLNTSTKKYFSIVLFGMDAKEYMKSSLIWNLFVSLLLNSLCFFVFSSFLDLSFSICLLFVLFSLFVRIVGEGLNLYFYKKFHYIWYNNTFFYFLVLTILLGVSVLPMFSIFISFSFICVSVILSFFLSIVWFLYLNSVDDYQLIYKKLNTLNMAMNSDNEKAYSRQAMVEVKDKDKFINNKKIIGKKGYDLFNTIFFERHKEILFRSSKKYSIALGVIYIVILVIVIINNSLVSNVHTFLLNRLSWFVIIMYFINRGSIVTQAMFFNCDHAMLTYNFYREPRVLLGLFKRRLVTVIKVNLLPAIVIAIGNLLLLMFTGGTSVINYITTFLFIILLSVFFSVHYMVIYYLLQPYNKNMEMKKISYSFVSFVTYILAYKVSDFYVSSFILSIFGVCFTIIYIILSLVIIYKKAPETFKIN